MRSRLERSICFEISYKLWDSRDYLEDTNDQINVIFKYYLSMSALTHKFNDTWWEEIGLPYEAIHPRRSILIRTIFLQVRYHKCILTILIIELTNFKIQIDSLTRRGTQMNT